MKPAINRSTGMYIPGRHLGGSNDQDKKPEIGIAKPTFWIHLAAALAVWVVVAAFVLSPCKPEKLVQAVTFVEPVTHWETEKNRAGLPWTYNMSNATMASLEYLCHDNVTDGGGIENHGTSTPSGNETNTTTTTTGTSGNVVTTPRSITIVEATLEGLGQKEHLFKCTERNTDVGDAVIGLAIGLAVAMTTNAVVLGLGAGPPCIKSKRVGVPYTKEVVMVSTFLQQGVIGTIVTAFTFNIAGQKNPMAFGLFCVCLLCNAVRVLWGHMAVYSVIGTLSHVRAKSSVSAADRPFPVVNGIGGGGTAVPSATPHDSSGGVGDLESSSRSPQELWQRGQAMALMLGDVLHFFLVITVLLYTLLDTSDTRPHFVNGLVALEIVYLLLACAVHIAFTAIAWGVYTPTRWAKDIGTVVPRLELTYQALFTVARLIALCVIFYVAEDRGCS